MRHEFPTTGRPTGTGQKSPSAGSSVKERGLRSGEIMMGLLSGGLRFRLQRVFSKSNK
jgi:hypothetical protein